MLSIGIVGLPNVGKSTLFNALTRSKQAEAQNYPFCTIEPNVGIVEVPDERLNALSDSSKSLKIVPTAIKFVDIAGLVEGASKGEGLGNKFLSHIREVDAIVHVVRSFADPNVTHVDAEANPKKDAKVINTELILADWQVVQKRLEAVKKQAKGMSEKELAPIVNLLEKINTTLEAEQPARSLEYDEEEQVILKELQLITLKPMLYVVNVSEDFKPEEQVVIEEGTQHIYVSAKLEAELAELGEEEALEYLKEVGIEETGLDKLIRKGYEILGLVTFFTSGVPETRAWTVIQNTLAPEAAGVIHTDFIKGFIKADVVGWQDFVDNGGWNDIKSTGKMRLAGKDYIVQDGDVIYFHVNT